MLTHQVGGKAHRTRGEARLTVGSLDVIISVAPLRFEFHQGSIRLSGMRINDHWHQFLGFGRLLRFSAVCGEKSYILVWPDI